MEENEKILNNRINSQFVIIYIISVNNLIIINLTWTSITIKLIETWFFKLIITLKINTKWWVIIKLQRFEGNTFSDVRALLKRSYIIIGLKWRI